MTHTIETLKELHEKRFDAAEKAVTLAADEIERRLEILNHSHEILREKERTFVNREAFEMFRQRVADDISFLRNETQAAANMATRGRESALKAVSEGILEQNIANEKRFGKMEAVHAKIIGGLVLGSFVLPLITGLVIYVVTRSQ